MNTWLSGLLKHALLVHRLYAKLEGEFAHALAFVWTL